MSEEENQQDRAPAEGQAVSGKDYFNEVSGGSSTSNTMTHATPSYAPYHSTMGFDNLGGSAAYMDPILMKRPARKQVSARSYVEIHASDGQDYNIWYHKRPGFKKDKFEDRENPGTRCNVLTDAGKTKASKNAPFCVYFALGRCSLGHECTYQHRIPTFEDEDRLTLTHDIFGRERHSTDKEDMSGIGNFMRECRTLYIGAVKVINGGNVEDAIRKHFEEWGPIEYCRIIHTKSIAFVRYYMRASAEFAKEAMNNQSLDNNDILMLRWATDDSNPMSKEYEDKRSVKLATDAINKRLKIMQPEDQNTMHFQLTGEYPDTSIQYAAAQSTEFIAPNPYDYMYPESDNAVQHPYATMEETKRAAVEKARGEAMAATYAQYDPNNQYAAYYQYYNNNNGYYGTEGYQYTAPEEVYSEFVPAYKTAADVLNAQENEEEEAPTQTEATTGKKRKADEEDETKTESS